MTRYYYTCPIKALYMMKEFGVKTYMEAKIISSCNLTTGEITKGGVDIFSFEEYFDDLLHNNLEALNRNDIIIYVAKESEHIFKQKEGDIGIQDEDGYLSIGKACEGEDFEDCNNGIIPSHYWTIIKRQGKLFFMPEVEND